MKKVKKGKLVVIDGVDGAGKATQAKKTVARLKRLGYKVKTIDFPHYSNFFGKLIGEGLTGKRGDFIAMDSLIVSSLYAADRFESSPKIKKWLNEGNIVICDRYVSANQIHQGGKIKDPRKRKEFLTLLDKMEYGIFKLPKPNLIIYLDLPINMVIESLKNKNLLKKKEYLRRKTDQAESNIPHLVASQKSARKMITQSNKWVNIDCTLNEVRLSPKEVNDIIFSIFLKKKII